MRTYKKNPLLALFTSHLGMEKKMHNRKSTFPSLSLVLCALHLPPVHANESKTRKYASIAPGAKGCVCMCIVLEEELLELRDCLRFRIVFVFYFVIAIFSSWEGVSVDIYILLERERERERERESRPGRDKPVNSE